MAVGLALALALALLSYVRVSSDGLAFRKPETWSNASVLVLSEPTFAEGRSELPANTDPNRFAALVDQYAAFATSDDVISSLKRQGLLRPDAGDTTELPITATAVPSTVTGAATPLLKISAEAPSPAAATTLAIRATDTFIGFVRARQVAAKIPENQRIELTIVTRAGVPELTGPRGKTTPIIIFLAVLTIVVAAVFIRDNMQRERDDRLYQLEAARVLDPLQNTRETGAPPEPDPVPAARAAEPDSAADAGSAMRTRWSSRSSR